MNKVKNLVDNLGFSKYEIAKKIGVSWNTVHMWYLGVYEPSLEHKEAINEKLQEKGV